ncbi:MAG: hypothetical protein Q7J15_13280 [Candidatus Desulfaltia sp.]|nr:hypothetical protein [Candidatus Desulfaltia sp.]
MRSEKGAVFLNFSGISDMREKALDIPDIRGFMRRSLQPYILSSLQISY